MSQNGVVGFDICRACSSKDLFSGIDLGELPIANELFLEPAKYELFPLNLKICSNCGLGQVRDAISSNRLFRNYRYLSSISSTFLCHAKKYAEEVLEHLDWRRDDWILEIASNDGYLLKNFVEHGKTVLGIEPAINIAQIARSAGIPTINEFFSSKIAKQLLVEYGYPRLIIANNVLAHVPDIQDFTEGLSILMNERTYTSIENPSIMNLPNSMQFDSIYHEHYSYLSATAVSKLMNRFGLFLSHVERIETHGGSNRYWISKNQGEESSTVANIIESELSSGLLNESIWQDFAFKVRVLIHEFHLFIEEMSSHDQIIAGYGAAAKASTLINAARIGPNKITYIVDESPEKVGRFMPAPMIPIVGSEHLSKVPPNHIVIFPWNITSEIRTKIRHHCGSRVQIWRAIPKLEEII